MLRRFYKMVPVLPSLDPSLIFPFHILPSPVHPTGFSFYFFHGLSNTDNRNLTCNNVNNDAQNYDIKCTKSSNLNLYKFILIIQIKNKFITHNYDLKCTI